MAIAMYSLTRIKFQLHVDVLVKLMKLTAGFLRNVKSKIDFKPEKRQWLS